MSVLPFPGPRPEPATPEKPPRLTPAILADLRRRIIGDTVAAVAAPAPPALDPDRRIAVAGAVALIDQAVAEQRESGEAVLHHLVFRLLATSHARLDPAESGQRLTLYGIRGHCGIGLNAVLIGWRAAALDRLAVQ